MSVYAEHNVKTKALERFVGIVSANNKSLGEKLSRAQEAIREKALYHIQQIGVHAYAERVLGDRLGQRERGDLLFLIEE